MTEERAIDLIPIATTILLEGANVSQLIRMWTEHTAAGQSLLAWLSVCLALGLWAFYYWRKGLRTALWATLGGIVMNLAVVASVIYWRLA